MNQYVLLFNIFGLLHKYECLFLFIFYPRKMDFSIDNPKKLCYTMITVQENWISVKKGCEKMSIVGANVKRILKEQGRTQVYVSAKTGIKKTTLSNMLNGRQRIYDSDILKLAVVLGVTPNELFKPIKDEKSA